MKKNLKAGLIVCMIFLTTNASDPTPGMNPAVPACSLVPESYFTMKQI